MDVYLQPIEVVVSFTREGKICPVRFRMIDDSAGYETIYVKNVTRRRQEKAGKDFVDIYTCSGVIASTERIFELKYENRSGEWTLYRM